MWQSVAQSELRTVNTVCDTEGSTRPALPSPALPLIHCTLGNWPTGKSHYSVMIYTKLKLYRAVTIVGSLSKTTWIHMHE